ncbi:FIST N-terminal domain-containing protein [Actinoplanes sichuanensis]|uniref:FIST signal transduction protein n=1 Tax=Actinoplanes sichuanensis TaxID=512349 RepID=A0ABW4A619_9ACTN|nr:FIST N-terminal domain-containing protein [Actinoplanes sichuanensis]BEL05134.1 FIST N-terminal domain-containing protein [Actinoplanes sichuanensis]
MVDDSDRRRAGQGSSTHADPQTAARESVAAALGGRTPEAADLVIAHATVDYDPLLFFEAVAEAAAPAQVVGCTAYAGFTGSTTLSRGAVTLYLPAAELTFGVAAADSVSGDLRGAARRVTESARERAGGDGEHSVLMMLTDGLAGDLREVVRGSYAVTGATVPLVGGAASENLSMGATHQFADGKLMSNSLIAVWINSPHPLGIGVAHGWHPIGDPMTVTRAEGNVIHELDGRPAVDAYLGQRGDQLPAGEPEDGEGPTFARLTFDHPLGLANAAGTFDGRHILGRTAEGSLIMFGHVSEQSVVQVLAGNQRDLLDAAGSAAAAAVQRLGGTARGALVFSCAGRVTPLGDQVPEEAAAIRDQLGAAPFAGFFTYGEFARVTGSTGFHNATVVVLAL